MKMSPKGLGSGTFPPFPGKHSPGLSVFQHPGEADYLTPPSLPAPFCFTPRHCKSVTGHGSALTPSIHLLVTGAGKQGGELPPDIWGRLRTTRKAGDVVNWIVTGATSQKGTSVFLDHCVQTLDSHCTSLCPSPWHAGVASKPRDSNT